MYEYTINIVSCDTERRKAKRERVGESRKVVILTVLAGAL
jgi:hypothetical protein